MAVAAQISVYPLRKAHLSDAIARTLRVFQKHGLEVQPGAMSSVLVGEDDALFDALKEAFQQAAQQGEVVMVLTLSNACPVPDVS